MLVIGFFFIILDFIRTIIVYMDKVVVFLHPNLYTFKHPLLSYYNLGFPL